MKYSELQKELGNPYGVRVYDYGHSTAPIKDAFWLRTYADWEKLDSTAMKYIQENNKEASYLDNYNHNMVIEIKVFMDDSKIPLPEGVTLGMCGYPLILTFTWETFQDGNILRKVAWRRPHLKFRSNKNLLKFERHIRKFLAGDYSWMLRHLKPVRI